MYIKMQPLESYIYNLLKQTRAACCIREIARYVNAVFFYKHDYEEVEEVLEKLVDDGWLKKTENNTNKAYSWRR